MRQFDNNIYNIMNCGMRGGPPGLPSPGFQSGFQPGYLGQPVFNNTWLRPLSESPQHPEPQHMQQVARKSWVQNAHTLCGIYRVVAPCATCGINWMAGGLYPSLHKISRCQPGSIAQGSPCGHSPSVCSHNGHSSSECDEPIIPCRCVADPCRWHGEAQPWATPCECRPAGWGCNADQWLRHDSPPVMFTGWDCAMCFIRRMLAGVKDHDLPAAMFENYQRSRNENLTAWLKDGNHPGHDAPGALVWGPSDVSRMPFYQYSGPDMPGRFQGSNGSRRSSRSTSLSLSTAQGPQPFVGPSIMPLPVVPLLEQRLPNLSAAPINAPYLNCDPGVLYLPPQTYHEIPAPQNAILSSRPGDIHTDPHARNYPQQTNTVICSTAFDNDGPPPTPIVPNFSAEARQPFKLNPRAHIFNPHPSAPKVVNGSSDPAMRGHSPETLYMLNTLRSQHSSDSGSPTQAIQTTTIHENDGYDSAAGVVTDNNNNAHPVAPMDDSNDDSTCSLDGSTTATSDSGISSNLAEPITPSSAVSGNGYCGIQTAETSLLEPQSEPQPQPEQLDHGKESSWTRRTINELLTPNTSGLKMTLPLRPATQTRDRRPTNVKDLEAKMLKAKADVVRPAEATGPRWDEMVDSELQIQGLNSDVKTPDVQTLPLLGEAPKVEKTPNVMLPKGAPVLKVAVPDFGLVKRLVAKTADPKATGTDYASVARVAAQKDAAPTVSATPKAVAPKTQAPKAVTPKPTAPRTPPVKGPAPQAQTQTKARQPLGDVDQNTQGKIPKASKSKGQGPSLKPSASKKGGAVQKPSENQTPQAQSPASGPATKGNANKGNFRKRWNKKGRPSATAA